MTPPDPELYGRAVVNVAKVHWLAPYRNRMTKFERDVGLISNYRDGYISRETCLAKLSPKARKWFLKREEEETP